MSHLWEVEHPYIACEGNYFSNDCHEDFEDWYDFLDAHGDADLDMNLVYRWDWREGEDWEVPEGEAELWVYFIGQRKAITSSVRVRVKRVDETEIIEYLKPRFERLMEIWAPISFEPDQEDVA